MTRMGERALAVLRMPISRGQLGFVAVASAAATAVILTAGPARGPIESLALAALHNGSYQVRVSGGPAAAPADAATPSAAAPAAQSGGDAAASGGGGAAAANDSALAGADTSAVTTDTTATTTTPATSPPPAKAKAGHVFVIGLSTPSFAAAFGPGSVAHYLNGTLRRRGTLLGNYQSLDPGALPDFLAMVSGQPPNSDTEAGCATYTDFGPAAKPGDDGTVPGNGCVYPNTVLTVADQVTAGGGAWRGYVEGIAGSPCPHPDSGAADNAEPAGAGPDYDTRHNPFIYFHSLLDLGGCASNDVSLDQLSGDLAKPKRTPTFAFLAPGLCADGAATTCAGGSAFGLAAEDAFLRQWVPKILHSAAYRKDGVLIVAFAHTEPSGSSSLSTAGVRTGALVLSPHAARGRTVAAPYDAYSVLRTTEDLLALKPLGEAAPAKSFVSLAVP